MAARASLYAAEKAGITGAAASAGAGPAGQEVNSPASREKRGFFTVFEGLDGVISLDAWLQPDRSMWSERLDALERHLDDMTD